MHLENVMKEKYTELYERLQSYITLAKLLNYIYLAKEKENYILYIFNKNNYQIDIYIHFWGNTLFKIDAEVSGVNEYDAVSVKSYKDIEKIFIKVNEWFKKEP